MEGIEAMRLLRKGQAKKLEWGTDNAVDGRVVGRSKLRG
jgi:hypothetical protein